MYYFKKKIIFKTEYTNICLMPIFCISVSSFLCNILFNLINILRIFIKYFYYLIIIFFRKL